MSKIIKTSALSIKANNVNGGIIAEYVDHENLSTGRVMITRRTVRDHIASNIERYCWWFDQNGYIHWRDSSPLEAASEMAASCWQQGFIIADVILTFSERKLENA